MSSFSPEESRWNSPSSHIVYDADVINALWTVIEREGGQAEDVYAARELPILKETQECNIEMAKKQFFEHIEPYAQHLFPTVKEYGFIAGSDLRNFFATLQRILPLAGLKKCSFEMSVDFFVRGDIHMLSWYVTRCLAKKVFPYHDTPRYVTRYMYLFMYQYLYKEFNSVCTALENDPTIVHSLHARPNTVVFARDGQEVDFSLQDIALISYNVREKLIAVLNITDALSAEELVHTFADTIAERSPMIQQEIFVLSKLNDREELFAMRSSQPIVDFLLQEEYFHDEESHMESIYRFLTKERIMHIIQGAGEGNIPLRRTRHPIKMRKVDRDLLTSYDEVTVTINAREGIAVDICDMEEPNSSFLLFRHVFQDRYPFEDFQY